MTALQLAATASYNAREEPCRNSEQLTPVGVWSAVTVTYTQPHPYLPRHKVCLMGVASFI